MKSSQHGDLTSKLEVTNISQHGFWLFHNGKEYFLPFEKYPWFRDAMVSDILNVEHLHDDHFYWPALDVDLSVSILEDPDKYKLIYK